MGRLSHGAPDGEIEGRTGHGNTGTPEVTALLERSHRLGSDPRVTNFAGGNTSCKARELDPVTAGSVELLWVKGSGGDSAP